MYLWDVIWGVGVFFCRNVITDQSTVNLRNDCSHLGWSAWWFSTGRPNRSEPHSCAACSRQALRAGLFFCFSFSWCACRSRRLCFFSYSLFTGADAVRPELPGIPAAPAAPWSAGRWGRTPAEAERPWEKQTPVTAGHLPTLVRWITAICIHVHALPWTLRHLEVTCNTILLLANWMFIKQDDIRGQLSPSRTGSPTLAVLHRWLLAYFGFVSIPQKIPAIPGSRQITVCPQMLRKQSFRCEKHLRKISKSTTQ